MSSEITKQTGVLQNGHIVVMVTSKKLNIVCFQPFNGLFLALLKNTHHGIIPFPRQQPVYKTTAPVYNVMTCVMTHSSGMCVYNDYDLRATDAPSVFFHTNVQTIICHLCLLLGVFVYFMNSIYMSIFVINLRRVWAKCQLSL